MGFLFGAIKLLIINVTTVTATKNQALWAFY
jgi:hypothetical protein